MADKNFRYRMRNFIRELKRRKVVLAWVFDIVPDSAESAQPNGHDEAANGVSKRSQSLSARQMEGQRSGHYDILDRLQIPDTVQAELKSRLDRLDPEAREVLRCTAVIG
jgi:predicted ATPase